MTSIFRKTILLAICLFLVTLSGFPVHAESEETGDPEDQTYQSDSDDGVEQYIPEESQNETIHSDFYVITVKKTRSLEVPFNSKWFQADARTYSHDLAKLSLGLATAAFRPKVGVDEKDVPTDANLIHFLNEAHFTDLRSDDYDKNPSMYTVSTVMGHQRIGEGDDAFELIAVGVCGQGYLDEWESNFSIGTGNVHEGFDRSSTLIYDRIFGYIASHHLQGPLKIWLSGFSRAAAVTNITAARLSDSPAFSQSSVFAYTFATPRTVREENTDRYQNIFNIVGKTDPVPNVPFSDWGYSRYGSTFYLPAPETDSDYHEKREKANEVYKQLTGIDYWYNLESDEALKIILAYFLELCPTVEVYAASLQDKLIGIWADRRPVNVIRNLLELANDPLLISEEKREHANMLLNYLSGFVMAYLNESSIFRSWNPTASAGANMLQAHTPELYVSWIFSAKGGSDLYNVDNSYSEFYINSTDQVSLIRNGTVIENIAAIYGPDDDLGTMTRRKKEPETPQGNIYLRYTEDSIMCTLPRDEEYAIRIPASNGDNYFSILQLDYTTESQTPVKTRWISYTIDQSDELTVTIRPNEEPQISSRKPLDKEKLDLLDDLEFDVTGIVVLTKIDAVISLPWRTITIGTISVFFFIVTLLLFFLTYLIGRTRFNRRIKKGWLPEGSTYGKVPVLCMYAMFLLFVIKEFFGALYPDNQLMQVIFKFSIGLLSIIAAYAGYVRNRKPLSFRLLIALALLTFADLITTFSIPFGSIAHIAAYAMLIYSYLKEEKPDKKQIIVWGILAFLGLCIILSIKGSFGLQRLLAILYLIASLTMVCTSFSLPRRVFTGSLLLFAAGCLLMANVINGQTFLSHILSLGTYYLAIGFLACANTRISIPKLVPETLLYKQQEEE